MPVSTELSFELEMLYIKGNKIKHVCDRLIIPSCISVLRYKASTLTAGLLTVCVRSTEQKLYFGNKMINNMDLKFGVKHQPI